MLRIVVQRDGDVVLDSSFNDALVSIGRAADNTIVLDSPQVSARHLLVKRNSAPATFLLLDQSTNGTVVSGETVDRLLFSTAIVASLPPFELTFVPILKSDTDARNGREAVAAALPHAELPPLSEVRGRGNDVELRALDSDGTEQTAVFAESAVIGRTADCDLQLLGRDVSRRHALVCRAGGQFQLRRLSAINGVSVNGRELAPEEAVLLQDGDLVKIASHELLFFSPATRGQELDGGTVLGRAASPNFDLEVETRKTTDPSIAAFDLIGFLGEKTAARVTPRIVPSFSTVSRAIIDLGYLIGADELGLHALAALVNEADRRGVAVQIIRIQPRVSDILSASPLDKVLRRFIARSEESAIRRLQD